jgi:hypothetical protein
MELKNVVKFFIFLIVIVFDPLAVALIIAFNGLIETKKEKQRRLLGEMIEYDQKLGLYDEPFDNQMIKKNLDDLIEKNYKDYKVYGDNIVNENKKNETNAKNEETPVDSIDDMGNITLNDAVIDENTNLKWEEYMHPEFPWNKRNLWINNPKAVQYWLNSKGGSAKEFANIKREEENTKTY